ncbi:tetratricopeptide repeat protein [Candidatus Falkowbacteria bacterium]|nr:tetratricopeptide repeat protein [Candidatus Falkowbacteria bacterium]
MGILYDHLAQTKKIICKKLLLHHKAKNIYQQILKHYPKSKKGLIGLGRIYWHKNKASKSLSYYNQALAITPNDAQILNSMANVYKMSGDDKQAQQYYQKAIATSQATYGTYFNFVRLLIRTNQKKKAQEILDHGKKLSRSQKLSKTEKEIISDLENQIKNL